MLTAFVPRLNSSMKSFLNVAPVLPPPPYTWLITTFCGPTAWRLTVKLPLVERERLSDTVNGTLYVPTANATDVVNRYENTLSPAVASPFGGVELPNAVLCGLGGPTVKSARLLSVSLAPFALRSAAVVLVSAGVG